MTGLLQDLRYGFRQLRKNPGFTTVTVLTLALGIGVNAAMFAVIDAVLLRPFPFPAPNEIVRMSEASPTDVAVGNSALPDIRDWRAQTTLSRMSPGIPKEFAASIFPDFSDFIPGQFQQRQSAVDLAGCAGHPAATSRAMKTSLAGRRGAD